MTAERDSAADAKAVEGPILEVAGLSVLLFTETATCVHRLVGICTPVVMRFCSQKSPASMVPDASYPM